MKTLRFSIKWSVDLSDVNYVCLSPQFDCLFRLRIRRIFLSAWKYNKIFYSACNQDILLFIKRYQCLFQNTEHKSLCAENGNLLKMKEPIIIIANHVVVRILLDCCMIWGVKLKRKSNTFYMQAFQWFLAVPLNLKCVIMSNIPQYNYCKMLAPVILLSVKQFLILTAT